MRVEVYRMIAAALADPVSGVNAILPSLPRDGADPLPPQVGAILNEGDHNLDVREGDETRFPLLIVANAKAFVGKTSRFNGVQDWGGDIVVAYLLQGASTVANDVATDYTLRAAKRSVLSLFTGDGSDAKRTRNGVALAWVPIMSVGLCRQAEFGGVMTGALTLTCTVRELNP